MIGSLLAQLAGDDESVAEDAEVELGGQPASEVLAAALPLVRKASDGAFSDKGVSRLLGFLSGDANARDISRVQTESLIEEIERLYKRRFASYSEDPTQVVFMTWDMFCNPWSRRRNFREAADRVVKALSAILEIPNPLCKRAAIHGLGHVRHPAAATVLRAYLSTTGDAELKEYAERALKHNIQ